MSGIPELNPRETKAAAAAIELARRIVDFDLTGLEYAVERKRERLRALGWENADEAFQTEEQVACGVRAFRKAIGQ
jgi:hypothetical protein